MPISKLTLIYATLLLKLIILLDHVSAGMKESGSETYLWQGRVSMRLKTCQSV